MKNDLPPHDDDAANSPASGRDLRQAGHRRRALLGLGAAGFAALALSRLNTAIAGTPVAGTITDARFHCAALADRLHYKIYQPAAYQSTGMRYPVLYLLHGRGDNFTAWTRMAPMLDALIASGKISPCLVVMPDLPSSSRASYYVNSDYRGADQGKPVEDALTGELIAHIDATWRSDPQRQARAIGGYSMGGYGALRYALAYPALFSAAIVLSPAVYVPLPPAGSSTREYGAFGLGESMFVDAIYQAKNYPALLAGLKENLLPLHFFIGSGDDEYKNPAPDEKHDIDMEAHRLYSSLVRAPNIKAELRIVNGGHDWDAWEPLFREGLMMIFSKLRSAQ